MKKYFCFLIFACFLVNSICFGDVIIGNFHYVSKCVKITNVDDYPDISLIGYTASDPQTNDAAYIVSSSQCLTKGYGYGSFNIFAVNKSYLKGKNLDEIKFPEDKNVIPSSIILEPYIGHVNDSIPISSIEQFYKIAGFTDSAVVIYKWKQITKYNNGKPDLTETFTYNGEISPLYQKIMVGVNAYKKQSVVEVFPNPAHKNIHLRINDSYKGSVAVEVVSVGGEVLKSFTLSKQETILDYDIPVASVAKGACLIKIQMGKVVEYKKIVIQ